MNFEMFATWVVVGLLTGLGAGMAMKDGGYGRLWDVILGLVGSSTASMIVWVLGVASEAGNFTTAIVAFVGAAAVIVAQRKVWDAHA